MPNLKFLKRRSSGNVLDLPEAPSEPTGSSFRVLERPDKATHSFDGGAQKSWSQAGRPLNNPLQQLRGRSEEQLGHGLNPKERERERGSGGTTNSGSSAYYDSSASARHSSSSTLPSSVDQEREPEGEELYPRKPATMPMYQPSAANAADEPLPPPPSFKSRVRGFSFSPKHGRTNSISNDANSTPVSPVKGPPRSPETAHSTIRDRSMTNSSYASTAKPNKAEMDYSLGSTNFGDDFGNMFDNFGKKSREDLTIPSPSSNGAFHRTESEPMFPPRAMSRQAFTPSPNFTRNARVDPSSPYSYDERDSVDGLMSGSTLSSPRMLDEGPPVPNHSSGIAPAFLGRGKAGYALVPERNPSLGFEESSYDSHPTFATANAQEKDGGYANRQTQLDDGDRWSKRTELRDPQKQSLPNTGSNRAYEPASSTRASNRNLHPQSQATAGAARPGATSPGSEEGGSLFDYGSSSTTPRANKLAAHGLQDEPLFDSSPLGPPSRAVRPGHERTESGTPKKMTRAQFEALQKSGNSSREHSEDEVHDGDYDDEDDIERAMQATKQRRKQQANMAVYRQQMKKVTGGGLADLPSNGRPGAERASSSATTINGMSSLHLGGIGGAPPPDAFRGKQSDDDDDEDVPLGILQAHGFPSASRPPTRLGENIDHQRRPSMAGSVANGGAGQGALPPFARRLPADPYFGASLVNPPNRESLAFSSAQSAYGGAPPPMGQPGGLVGVIASEERAKAMRRGSPNQYTGTYTAPLPANMPQMPRTMSMGSVVTPNVYTPSGYMPGMPPMPQMMPQSQTEQQMQQFMQMQMQVMQNMQNMLAMQQQMGQGTPQPQPQTQDYLGVPMGGQRPMSMASQGNNSFMNGAPGQQGRAMTMMNPPSMWNYNQAQQRPASAMPNTYAPSVMNGGGPGPGYTPSIAPSERSNVGLPPRYRPVSTVDANTGRANSMTSSMTLQALGNQQRPESRAGQQKSTIRIIDKPKGSPKVSSRPVDPEDDEDDGWAELAKKREQRKWRKNDSKAGQEPGLSDLYQSYE